MVGTKFAPYFGGTENVAAGSFRDHLAESAQGPYRSLTPRVPLTPPIASATAVHLRHRPGVMGESPGVRSTVVGFHVVGAQTVEEFPYRPLGSEHVKGHMLPMLRNDLAFALRF